MLVENNVALQPLNTFGIAARAQSLARVRSEADIAALLGQAGRARRRRWCWAAAATW